MFFIANYIVFTSADVCIYIDFSQTGALPLHPNGSQVLTSAEKSTSMYATTLLRNDSQLDLQVTRCVA